MSLANRYVGFFCVGLIVLALGPIARSFVVQPIASINRVPLPALGNCISMHGWSADWFPTFLAPDYSISDSYQCDGYRLHVSLVQYIEQRQGKEAVSEFNSVIPRTWWNATTRGRQVVAPDLEVNEYRVDLTPIRLTIWNWYAVGNQATPSELTTKAIEALDALRQRSRPTTNITIAVEADPSFDATGALKLDAASIWAWFEAETRSTG